MLFPTQVKTCLCDRRAWPDKMVLEARTHYSDTHLTQRIAQKTGDPECTLLWPQLEDHHLDQTYPESRGQ